MKTRPNNNHGFILLLTFILLAAMTVMVGALLFMASVETRDTGAGTTDSRLLYLANAGVQLAYREIRDEVLSASPTTGTADLRGNTTAGTAGAGMPRIRYYDESNPKMLTMSEDSTVVLSDFDLNYLESINSNIAGSVIKNVKIGCRYERSGPGGDDPTLEVLYTTDGSFPQAGNSSIDIPVSSTSFNDPYANYTVLDITNDRTPWRWDYINNPNFQIRLRCYGSPKDVDVEYLFLQVTYETDTLEEGWATDDYASFPIVLGSGKIQSVTVADEATPPVTPHVDEQGKVHLNTATQSLIENLMINTGIDSVTANTLAANIANYRTGTKLFDSVEELQLVTDMSALCYEQIRPYVTVYSFITSNARNPTYLYGRAPVNINTAPYAVLKAIFDPQGLDGSDPASLANDIITSRETNPFTCFYTADTAVATDFYDFVTGRGYLTAAEQNIVLNNADSSPLPPVAGSAIVNGVTTEFCYSSTAFRIVSIADSDPNPAAQGRRFRVQTVLGYDGSRTFTTFYGTLPANQDTTPVGYRKENYQ